LALSVAEAREMIDACSRAGVVLGTNHHLREAASHRKIRELIRSGAVGEPRFAKVFHAGLLPAHLQGWRLKDPRTGAGAILDLTVHDADALRFLLGAEPVEVVALLHQGGRVALAGYGPRRARVRPHRPPRGRAARLRPRQVMSFSVDGSKRTRFVRSSLNSARSPGRRSKSGSRRAVSS